MKYKCPCCGYYTFSQKPNGNYDICPVCFWEDDIKAFSDIHKSCSSNNISLVQARKNFSKFGACMETMIDNVRPPKNDELIGYN